MEIEGFEIDGYSNHIHLFSKIFELKKIKNMFEYGCGKSSEYLVQHCDKLISLEMQSELYYEKTKSQLLPKYLDKFAIFCAIGQQNWDFINKFSIPFDLVFVDGHGDSRPECINNAFILNIPIIVTHDTEYSGYRWNLVNMPENYFCYNFKEYNNWTTVYTRDKKLYDTFVEWKPFDNLK